MNVVAFTKSAWSEAPRLRHQVAHLLLAHGHRVLFFERPADIFTLGLNPSEADHLPPGLALGRNRQLLHHQLRITPTLSRANAEFEKLQIRRLVDSYRPEAVINFNYDYYFLRELFPKSKIVSIFNDDFIAGARLLSRKEARRLVCQTARMSDHNLVVSYPLLDQIRTFTDRVSLFFPWCRREYATPPAGQKRDEMLYWGYINDRIDVRAVTHVMDQGIKINFVGPVSGTRRSRALLEHRNAEYHGERPLDRISAVLARCASSILPYDAADRQVAAITINNRAFDLLSAGLPLLYRDLPGLLEAPAEVIRRCHDGAAYVREHRQAAQQFDAAQPAIQEFLANHTPSARYRQLSELISDPN
jgi:hypothetical protein